MTQENLTKVWTKVNEFPILFDDLYRGKLDEFVASLLDPSAIILATGDYGLVRICNIRPHRDVDMHLTFWDRRFKGRGDECKQALLWLFSKLDLVRATVTLPAIVFATIAFTKSLGFKEEGVIRKAYSYKGDLLDIHLFGLLRSQLFKEE
jgi:RimJ/RimL family protein N-acetyltransferase